MHHLLTMAKELEALGVQLVVTDQQIDTTTVQGRFTFAILSAVGELEAGLIRERVVRGLERVRAEGRKLGPRFRHRVDVERASELLAAGCSLREVGRQLGVHPYLVSRAVRGVNNPLAEVAPEAAPIEVS